MGILQASGAVFDEDAKAESARTILAKHIIAAATQGERDQGRLRDGAIVAFATIKFAKRAASAAVSASSVGGAVRVVRLIALRLDLRVASQSWLVTVAETTFGCDDATRQRILDDLVREIWEFEAEYASTSGSEMRHGQRPVLSRPRFDL